MFNTLLIEPEYQFQVLKLKVRKDHFFKNIN